MKSTLPQHQGNLNEIQSRPSDYDYYLTMPGNPDNCTQYPGEKQWIGGKPVVEHLKEEDTLLIDGKFEAIPF